jgi:hypothetical protein
MTVEFPPYRKWLQFERYLARRHNLDLADAAEIVKYVIDQLLATNGSGVGKKVSAAPVCINGSKTSVGAKGETPQLVVLIGGKCSVGPKIMNVP